MYDLETVINYQGGEMSTIEPIGYGELVEALKERIRSALASPPLASVPTPASPIAQSSALPPVPKPPSAATRLIAASAQLTTKIYN